MKQNLTTINYQLLIILAIFSVSLLGSAFLVVKPKLLTVKEKYQALSRAQTELDLLVKKRKNLEQLKKQEQRIDQDLQKAHQAFPSQKEVADFLVQLETSALETGSALSSVSFQEAVKKDGSQSPLMAMTFSLSIKGKFQNLMAYLNLLESLSRFNLVPALSIVSQPDNQIETKIDGEIYYFGQEEKTQQKAKTQEEKELE